MHRVTWIVPLALGATFIAACGSDSSGPQDGFECLGQALPTTAPALIDVTGQVLQNVISPNALGGAPVFAFRTGDTTHIAADTSSTPGFFDLSITTGGTPVDGYLRVTDSAHITTYAYPARPLADNATETVLMVTNTEVTLIGPVLGVTQTAGNGLMAIVVENCAGTPIAGATVSVTPGGTVRYNGPSGPDQSASSTAADGVAYVFNVPAGNVVVHASASGHTLRQHTVNARADVLTLTSIQP